MTDTPTPLPWRLGKDATGKVLTIWGARIGICVTSVFDDRLGDDSPPMLEAEANARMIVRAVNNHDALVDALRLALGTLVDVAPDQQDVIQQGQLALAKAGEGA